MVVSNIHTGALSVFCTPIACLCLGLCIFNATAYHATYATDASTNVTWVSQLRLGLAVMYGACTVFVLGVSVLFFMARVSHNGLKHNMLDNNKSLNVVRYYYKSISHGIILTGGALLISVLAVSCAIFLCSWTDSMCISRFNMRHELNSLQDTSCCQSRHAVSGVCCASDQQYKDSDACVDFSHAVRTKCTPYCTIKDDTCYCECADWLAETCHRNSLCEITVWGGAATTICLLTIILYFFFRFNPIK